MMFKKVFMVVVALLLAGLLTACGSQSSNSTGSSVNKSTSHVISKSQKEKQAKIDKAVKKTGATITVNGLGKVTPIAFGYSDQLGINGNKTTSNVPVKFDKSSVTISNIVLAKIQPDNNGSQLLQSVDSVYAYMVTYTVKNGYPSKMEYTPGMFGIKTSTGSGSDNVSSQSITVPANGTSKHLSIIQLDSESSEVPKKALLTIPAPTQYDSMDVNTSLSNLDDKNISIQMLNIRQSVIKDHLY